MVCFAFVLAVLPGTEQLAGRPGETNPLGPVSAPVVLGVLLTSPAVGAILAVRQPSNPIGWLFLLIGFGFSIYVFSWGYVGRSVGLGADLPGYRLVDWVASWSITAAVGLAVIWVPMLFPDGHLPGSHWRPVAWVAAIGTASQVAVEALTTNGILPNPIAADGPVTDALKALGVFFLVGVLVAIAAVIVRYRRSRGPERQQLKWFLAAAGYMAIVLPIAGGTGNELAFYLFMLGMIAIPIAIGIAILRYRLYDIDRLISRTIGWALVTGILAAVFVGVVLALQSLLAGFTQGETLAVAASTLAAFALFQPLRRRIQVAVDRRFDRARYDGQLTVDAFAERLRDEVEFAEIDRDIHRVIDDAVRPTHVGMWLRERQGAGR